LWLVQQQQQGVQSAFVFRHHAHYCVVIIMYAATTQVADFLAINEHYRPSSGSTCWT
jgi:hypothetical protein